MCMVTDGAKAIPILGNAIMIIDEKGNPTPENPNKGEHLSVPEVVEHELPLTVAWADKSTRDTNNAAPAFDN